MIKGVAWENLRVHTVKDGTVFAETQRASASC